MSLINRGAYEKLTRQMRNDCLVDIMVRTGCRLVDLNTNKDFRHKATYSKKGRVRKKYYKKITNGKIQYSTYHRQYYLNRPKFFRKARENFIREMQSK